MGWAERLNPRSWINSDEATRREYAKKNAARDRAQYNDAMSGGAVSYLPAGLPRGMVDALVSMAGMFSRNPLLKRNLPTSRRTP
jgi:hypothetical protein